MEAMSPIEIVHPPRERWGSVLNLALSHRPFAERMRLTDALLRPTGTGRRDAGFDGLREARQAEQTVGAALAVLQPGRTGLIYQPRLVDGVGESVRSRLNAALDDYLRQNRVQLAQEVLALDADDDAARAKAAGYTIDVELIYLVADAQRFPGAPPPSDWTFEPYRPAGRARLERVLDLTFEATLDCPEINGVRSAADTVDGYQASGDFHPDAWRLICDGRQDVGCLIVGRHDAAMAELIYMGLIPTARRGGRAQELIAWAMWLARQVGCASLSVAVDARNIPAHRAYVRAGFVEFDKRRVLLRRCA